MGVFFTHIGNRIKRCCLMQLQQITSVFLTRGGGLLHRTVRLGLIDKVVEVGGPFGHQVAFKRQTRPLHP
jgi:hypothetical protein